METSNPEKEKGHCVCQTLIQVAFGGHADCSGREKGME